MSTSTLRTEKFQRKPRDSKQKSDEAVKPAQEIVKFSPEEEAKLVEESNTQKATANTLFIDGKFQDAIEGYEEAIKTCPNYLDFEIAVLKSNVAACHLKLEDWKAAIKAANDALDGLDRLQGVEEKNKDSPEEGKAEEEEEEADEEIVSEGAKVAEKIDTTDKGKRKADIERIRTKALLRRAKGRSEQGGWGALQGAEEDYKTLSTRDNLSAADKKLVQRQLLLLPPRTKAAQETEMGEMMGKLKSLGNGILKPFGLSTDNFQMVKDEKSGGYSMNFNQGGPPNSK